MIMSFDITERAQFSKWKSSDGQKFNETKYRIPK